MIRVYHNPAGQIVTRAGSNSSYFAAPANATTTYANNGLNQVATLTGTGATSIAHDADGNLTTGLAQTYGYDALNQLTSAGSATLAYDPLGRLYSVGTGSTATHFLYGGQQVIAEYDASGAITARHVPGTGLDGMGLDDVVTSYAGAGTANRTWLLDDERGSVIGLTNGLGAATAINTYDEYGVPGSGNAGRFQYTGQMWLPGTGVYHYRARAYAPGIGRFLQPDPMGYAAGMGLYAYVGGDPINMVDPLGLCGSLTDPNDPACEVGEIVVTARRRHCDWWCQGGRLVNQGVDIIDRAIGGGPGPHPPHEYEPAPQRVCRTGESGGNCTEERVYQCLLRNPAPGASGAPVREGSRSRVPGLGTVYHIVSPGSLTVMNVTMPDHRLYPGTVTRQVVTQGNDIGIATSGNGTGSYGALNGLLAFDLWGYQTESIRACVRE